MKTRILSWFLILAMLLSVLPIGAMAAEETDFLQLAKDDLNEAAQYILERKTEPYGFGDEWQVFSLTRSGYPLSDPEISQYLDSVAQAYADGKGEQKPTTLARVLLALGVLEQNVNDFHGVHFVDLLVNNPDISRGSNEAAWALIALDSRNYEIPADALWTRDSMVKTLLDFQNADGGFGFGGTTSSPDLTGMALQALAPYHKESAVSQAVEKALDYLRHNRDANCGYGSAESVAQVVVALTALGLDPLDRANKFTMGSKNLISNLDSFQDPESGGFKYGSKVNDLSTVQAFYALESYRRFAENEAPLYQLEDPIPQYAITVQPAENGTVTVSAEKAPAGADITVTGTPDPGYVLDTLTVNGEALEYTDNTAVFSMPAQAVTVAAVFVSPEDPAAAVAEAIRAISVTEANRATRDALHHVREAYEALTQGEKDRIQQAYSELQEKEAKFAQLLSQSVEASVQELTAYMDSQTAGDYTEEHWAELKNTFDWYKNKLSAASCTEEVEDLRTKGLNALKSIPMGREIQVSFRLIGDFLHDEPENHESYVTWIPTTAYTLEPQSTVEDLFLLALEDAGLACETRFEGSYISKIQAPEILGGEFLGEFDNGLNSGWMYTQNGQHPGLGFQDQVLEDGDAIIFHYIDNYEEAEGAAWLEAPDITPEAYAQQHLSEIVTVVGPGQVSPALTLDDLYTSVEFRLEPETDCGILSLTLDGVALDPKNTTVSVENLDLHTRLQVEFSPMYPDYQDVSIHSWYFGDVRYVSQKGLMEGMGHGNFQPHTALSRAMLVTILYRMDGSPAVQNTTAFSDVDAGDWYVQAVSWAYENGIVNGMGHGKFAPNLEITREQTAAILFRYAGYKGYDTQKRVPLDGFIDMEKISDYAKEPLSWSVAEGLLLGRNHNDLVPQGLTKRSEAASLLHRYVETIVK